MFNLGFSELILVGVIALIFIGPRELPEVARVIGRMLNEFKRATGDLGTSFFEATRDNRSTGPHEGDKLTVVEAPAQPEPAAQADPVQYAAIPEHTAHTPEKKDPVT